MLCITAALPLSCASVLSPSMGGQSIQRCRIAFALVMLTLCGAARDLPALLRSCEKSLAAQQSGGYRCSHSRSLAPQIRLRRAFPTRSVDRPGKDFCLDNLRGGGDSVMPEDRSVSTPYISQQRKIWALRLSDAPSRSRRCTAAHLTLVSFSFAVSLLCLPSPTLLLVRIS